MTYLITRNGTAVVETPSSPLAEATWYRLVTDHGAGGRVVAFRDGTPIGSVQVSKHDPCPEWPGADHCGPQDVVRGILQLTRHLGWTPQAVTEAMGRAGLPTSRAKLKAMQGGRNAPQVSDAEIVVLLYGLIGSLRKGEFPESHSSIADAH